MLNKKDNKKSFISFILVALFLLATRLFGKKIA